MTDTAEPKNGYTDEDYRAARAWLTARVEHTGNADAAHALLVALDHVPDPGPETLQEWSEDLRGTWVEHTDEDHPDVPLLIVGHIGDQAGVLPPVGEVRWHNLYNLTPRPDLARVDLRPHPRPLDEPDHVPEQEEPLLTIVDDPDRLTVGRVVMDCVKDFGLVTAEAVEHCEYAGRLADDSARAHMAYGPFVQFRAGIACPTEEQRAVARRALTAYMETNQ